MLYVLRFGLCVPLSSFSSLCFSNCALLCIAFLMKVKIFFRQAKYFPLPRFWSRSPSSDCRPPIPLSLGLPVRAEREAQRGLRRSSKTGHSSKKWRSSSTRPLLQDKHTLSITASFAYLPFSMRSLLDPPLSFTKSEVPHPREGSASQGSGVRLSLRGHRSSARAGQGTPFSRGPLHADAVLL